MGCAWLLFQPGRCQRSKWTRIGGLTHPGRVVDAPLEGAKTHEAAGKGALDFLSSKPRRVLLISCFAALGWGTGLRKGNRDRECDAAVPTFQELLFPIIHAYEGLIYMGRTGNTGRGKLFMDHLLLDEYDILNPELGPPDSIDLDNPWGAAVPIGAITFGEQLTLGIG